MQRFDLAAIPPAPWKNGGGTTREIACWPPSAGGGQGTFGWRVSVAAIDRAGPFSAFPGIDRQTMLLHGGGVHLRGPGIDHRLATPWQPFAFAGEAAVDCVPLGGPATDFNLMLRRGAWQGAIQVVRHAVRPGAAPMGLCMVLAGTWRDAQGAAYAPGQGLWWSQPAPRTLAPEHAEGAALAWVELQAKSASSACPTSATSY